ncbi:MAG: patatin-like phospholipase family protein [Kiritimatiellia bacterium]
MKTLGVALGGGGARGLAHLPVLAFLDEHHLRPDRMAGTSIGSIVGALYASGKSAADIQADWHRYVVREEDRKRDVLKKIPDLVKWLGSVQFDFHGTGMVRSEKFLELLIGDLGEQTFEDLEIPLQVVATDFWSGEEVVIDSGPLLPAIMASMAIPGVFPPVEREGRVLVDGGMANNVPYDLLLDRCDFTLAVDVAPARTPGKKNVPHAMDVTLGMFDMLIEKVMNQKLAQRQPDLYLKPGIRDVRVLEFDKVDTIYRQAGEMVEELEKQLRELKLIS